MVRIRKTSKKNQIKASMSDPKELLTEKPEDSSKIDAAAAFSSPSVSRRERISLLAYNYWEQRGRPCGSPDEDWFRAERDIDPAE